VERGGKIKGEMEVKKEEIISIQRLASWVISHMCQSLFLRK